jgi:hypothetical protein
MTNADHAPTSGREGTATRNGPQAHFRSLHIENLKSLRGSHEVVLAPLTLIYGPNSAGKSSVLQAIRLVPTWLARIKRSLIETQEWRAIVAEHSRLISGHDESLQLTVGITYSGDPGSPPGHLAVEVRRNDHPFGFNVTLVSSDSASGASATFESDEVPDWPGPGFRFLPRPAELVAGVSADRLLRATFYLGPHRGDPQGYRRESFTPWHENPGSLEVEPINGWLSRLDVPYSVRAVSIEEADPDDADEPRMIDRTADWVDDSVPMPNDLYEFELTDTRSGVQVGLRDVGYGVGQILPIVDFCTRGADQVICIEQPELHLHPRLQGDLGELLVDSVIRGNQIIAETHSENLLLRVRRLIREQRIAAHDVAVVYVDNTDSGTVISRLRVGDSGQLLDPWPSGFFDDSLADILGVSR